MKSSIMDNRNGDMDDSNIELNITMEKSTKKVDYQTVV